MSYRVIACGLVSLLLAAACGQSEVAPDIEATVQARVEATSVAQLAATYTTYLDEAGLFSVSYPPEWEPLQHIIDEVKDFIVGVISSHELGVATEKASVLFSAGLPIETGWMPNVNLLVEPLPPGVATGDQYVEAAVRVISLVAQDYREISKKKTRVDGRDTTLLEYRSTFPDLPETHVLLSVAVVGQNAWLLTCTVAPGEFDKWASDCNAVARSLRILR